ncbi:MAG: hypothetical protein OEQ25_15850 [Gammaproteobacteria bacterium]|nr:hypothetical protein [Gammaproteobacteria bacterium]MDH3508609.1 hypothetical protein [Gammaproteobacteria bacterium]
MKIRVLLTSTLIVGGLPAVGTPQTAESQPSFFGVYAAPIFDDGVPPLHEPDVIPFTEEGRRVSEAYNPGRDDPGMIDDCAPDPVPSVVWSGPPIEILEEPGRIVIRYERANVVRSIDLAGTPPPADQPHTYLGYSIGRWEGDVLIIETTHMSGGAISEGSRPLSRDGRITERYWREPGESDLQLEVEIYDPAYYTEAFTMSRSYVWAPDEQLQDWGCVDFGPKDTPPDIDELVRMLEEL